MDHTRVSSIDEPSSVIFSQSKYRESIEMYHTNNARQKAKHGPAILQVTYKTISTSFRYKMCSWSPNHLDSIEVDRRIWLHVLFGPWQSHNLGPFRQAGMYGEARGDRLGSVANNSEKANFKPLDCHFYIKNHRTKRI